METSKHSFAVLVYGDSPFLENCLDSLNKQTVQSTIYIATSTPSASLSEIARKYQIPVYVTDTGKGIAHNWSFALSKADTKYVTLTHDDDIYLPGYAEECLKAAESYPDTLITFTDYSELVDDEERMDVLILKVKRLMLFLFMPLTKNIASRFWKKTSLSFGSYISCPTVMYNKQVLGDFTFSSKYSVDLDWEAWYRMALLPGKFVYVAKKLVQHRIHQGSETSVALGLNKRQEEDLEMFRKFWSAPIARLFARLYSRSYQSNKVK